MSWGRYPAYRESPISQFGKTPLHWIDGIVKRVFQVTLGKMVVTGSDTDDRPTRPYLRSANVQDGWLNLEDVKLMWFSEVEARVLTLQSGDLVVCEGGDVGRNTLLRSDLHGYGFQNSVNRVRPWNAGSTGFLSYWLSHLKTSGFIDVLCNRSTIAHYTAERLSATPLLTPPLAEQAAIAAFLDRETGKSDALVAEQERLIALLKEKRQAVISHAVTKGLNPDAPMKDSGVAWLGKVPAHWIVCRIGYHATVENGSTPSRDNQSYWTGDCEIPWITSGEVNQYVISEPSEFITRLALEQSSIRIVPIGAILVGLVGQGRTRGMAARMAIEGTINQNVAAIIPGTKLISEFLHYYLENSYDHLREYGRGGNQAALNCEILRAFSMAVPPLPEQQKIISMVNSAMNEIESLRSGAADAITLLRERRAALISAAVTGKIDVRDTVPATKDAA